jgi:hypothetical protein
VKYWEIIAGNLSKAGWSWAASQPWIPAGERSGLPTRIAATESGLSRTRMPVSVLCETAKFVDENLSGVPLA